MKVIIIHCAFKSALNCSGAKNTMIFRRQTCFSPSSFPGFWQYLRHSSTPKCHLHNSESGRVGQDSIPSASILPQKEYKTGEAASATFELHRHSPCRKDGATETKPFTIFFMSNNPADSSRGQAGPSAFDRRGSSVCRVWLPTAWVPHTVGRLGPA